MKAFHTAMLLVCSIALPNSSYGQDTEYKLDEVYKINPDGTIELYTDDADIQIMGSDRQDVRVKVYYKVDSRGITFGQREFELDVQERGGDLVIRERSYGGSGVFFGYISEQYEITIYAPVGVNLLLKGDDDDYIIRSINGSIIIDADDTDVDITNCKGSHFEFDIDDGDLEMDGGEGFLYIRSDDGDFIIRNGKFSEVNVSLDDGDLLLETSLADNGEYRFKVDDGDIDLRVLEGGGEFDISLDDGRVMATDEFQVIEKSEHGRLLRLSNGNARIRMTSNDGRIRLSRL